MISKHAKNSIDWNKSTQSIGLVHSHQEKKANTERSDHMTSEMIPKELTKKQVEEIKKSLICEQETLKKYSQKLLKKKEKGRTARTPISRSKLHFEAS